MKTKYYALVGNCKIAPDAQQGVTVLDFDGETGEMENPRSYETGMKVGNQLFDAKRNLLYVVDEYWSQPGRTGGGGHVASLRLDGHTGALECQSIRRTFGTNPSYAAQDKTGNYLLVTHHCTDRFVTKMVRTDHGYDTVTEYDLCTLLLYRLKEDGSIGEIADVYEVPGHDKRGEHAFPHLHCVIPDPESRFFIVCDKGLDKIYSFSIDYEKEKIVKADELDCEPISEPRYCNFHPKKPVFYFNGESSCNIQACGIDRGTGRLFPLGSCAIAEGEKIPDIWPCDLVVHPGGRLIFSSLRRKNLISVMHIGGDGCPILYQTVDCGGINPRGLGFSPDGSLLLSANTDSKTVTEFAIGIDGSLTFLRSIDVGGFPGNIQIVAVQDGNG